MTNRIEWLKARQAGIGGSDVAAILGLSKWRTPLDVYKSKTEPITDEEVSQAAYFGTILEDVVAKEFSKRTGMKIQRVNSILCKPKSDWMMANIDRAVINPEISGTVRVMKPEDQEEKGRMLTTDIILECKTANQFASDAWGNSQESEIVAGKVVTEHKIPLYYETQAQWYLAVTGAKICYVAVLLGGQDFRIYEVRRDEDVIHALTESCHAFWFDHVLKGVPPAPTRIEDVLKLFPHDNGEMPEANLEQATDIGELRNLTAQIKDLESQATAVKSRIIAAIGERSGFTIGGEKACTYKASKVNRFDSTRFKKEEPETYNEYLKTTESRTFRLAA